MQISQQDRKFIYPDKHRPRLNDKDGNLNKVWEVRFYLHDWEKNKPVLIRSTISEKYKTNLQRRAYARKLIQYFRKLQDEGYVRNYAPEPLASKREVLEVIQDILDFKKRVLKKNSMKGLNTAKSHLGNFIGNEAILVRDFDRMKFIEFSDYLRANVKSNRTYNNVCSNLNTIFEGIVERKIIPENPISFKKLPVLSNQHKAFTQEEKNLIFDWTKSNDPELHLFIVFLYYTCARPHSELRLLKVKDILPDTIFINAQNSKANKSAHIPINVPLRKAIQDAGLEKADPEFYVFGNKKGPGRIAVHDKYFYHHFIKALEELRLDKKGYDLYGLKHSRIIHLLRQVKTFDQLRQVQYLARHRSIQQTEQYARDFGVIFPFNQANSILDIE